MNPVAICAVHALVARKFAQSLEHAALQEDSAERIVEDFSIHLDEVAHIK